MYHLTPSSLLQAVLICQTIIIAATFAVLWSGMSPASPGGIQDEIRWGILGGSWTRRGDPVGQPCARGTY